MMMDLPILLAQAHPWLQDLFQVLSYAVPFVAVLFYLQRHLDSRLERLQQNLQHDFAGLVTDARRTLEGKMDRANDRPFPQPLPASEIQAMMDALRQQIMQASPKRPQTVQHEGEYAGELDASNSVHSPRTCR